MSHNKWGKHVAKCQLIYIHTQKCKAKPSSQYDSSVPLTTCREGRLSKRGSVQSFRINSASTSEVKDDLVKRITAEVKLETSQFPPFWHSDRPPGSRIHSPCLAWRDGEVGRMNGPLMNLKLWSERRLYGMWGNLLIAQKMDVPHPIHPVALL